MIEAKELKKTTDQCKLNIKACNELYIEKIIKNFNKKYKKDIKKIEKGILKQASKGLYMVTFQKTKLNQLQAIAYKKGITNYFEKFGYKVLIKDNEYHTSIINHQYRELVIAIKWED